MSSSVSSSAGSSQEVWQDALPSLSSSPWTTPYFPQGPRKLSDSSQTSGGSCDSALALLSSGAAHLLEQLEREGREVLQLAGAPCRTPPRRRSRVADPASPSTPTNKKAYSPANVASPVAGPSNYQKIRKSKPTRPVTMAFGNNYPVDMDEILACYQRDTQKLPIDDLLAAYDDMINDLVVQDKLAHELQLANVKTTGKRSAIPFPSSSRQPSMPFSVRTNRKDRQPAVKVSAAADLPYADMFRVENSSSPFPSRRPSAVSSTGPQNGPFPSRKRSVASLHSDAVAASRRVPIVDAHHAPPLPEEARDVLAELESGSSPQATPKPIPSTWSTRTLVISNSANTSTNVTPAGSPIAMLRQGSSSSNESNPRGQWSPSVRSSQGSYRGSDASWRWSTASGSTAPSSCSDDQASMLRKSSAGSAYSPSLLGAANVLVEEESTADLVSAAPTKMLSRTRASRDREDLVDWESFLEKEMPTSSPEMQLILPEQSALKGLALSTTGKEPEDTKEASESGAFPRLRKMKSAKTALRIQRSIAAAAASATGGSRSLRKKASSTSLKSNKTSSRTVFVPDNPPPVPGRTSSLTN